MPRAIAGTLPTGLSQVQTDVSKFIFSYCHQEAERAEAIDPSYARLWREAEAHVTAGGKRFRPYLVVAAYEAFGGADKQGIIQVAAAWELVHVAMLMHDDILDRDYVRHGKPNVAGAYLGHYAAIADEGLRIHYANGAALLAGDLLISAAYQLLLDSEFLPSQIKRAMRLLHEAIFTVVGGELLDVESSALGEHIDPLIIAENKTAIYSVVGPMLTGAVLAGADEVSQTQLRDLGMVLGVGFQFVDDVLGIFGDTDKTGKSVSSDLEEGKRTFVVLESLELMNAIDRAKAEALLAEQNPDNALELRKLIESTPIQRVLQHKIAGFKDAASSIVNGLSINAIHKKVFAGITSALLERQS